MTDLQEKLRLVFAIEPREWEANAADSAEARSARAYNAALAQVWGIFKGINPLDPETNEQKHSRLMAELVDLKRADDSFAVANLGLATTSELLHEIATRIEIDWYSGGGGLAYTTVIGRPEDTAGSTADTTRFAPPLSISKSDQAPEAGKGEGEDG